MSDSINLSAVSAHNPAVRDVILPLAYPYIDDWTTPYYRKLPIYKLLAPQFNALAASNFWSLWAGLSGQPRRIEKAYNFEGKDYPDYRRLAATTFARSKKRETCPETPSWDLAFTKSYYWWTYVATEDHSSLFGAISELHRYLLVKGKHLIFVLMPINFEYISKLDPSWPGAIRKSQLEFVDLLKIRALKLSISPTSFRLASLRIAGLALFISIKRGDCKSRRSIAAKIELKY